MWVICIRRQEIISYFKGYLTCEKSQPKVFFVLKDKERELSIKLCKKLALQLLKGNDNSKTEVGDAKGETGK